jgi:hypothetical protein
MEVRVGADVGFDLIPVAPVITDFLTARANGHDAPQGLELSQRPLQFLDGARQPVLQSDHPTADFDPPVQFISYAALRSTSHYCATRNNKKQKTRSGC